jgi:hypothetical protein
VPEPIELNTAIVALLRLAVVEREERAESQLASRKIELLLSGVGLTHAQIAAVTGKIPSAVRMTITRSPGKTKNKNSRSLRSSLGT